MKCTGLSSGSVNAYTGRPIEQHYTLTDLQLSNLRLNDQLLPNPQHDDMGKMLIRLPFPAEHPYASHISRTTMFPKFTGPDDPKTGTDARRTTPKNAHIPANPYDVIVVRKIKGNGVRHEIQSLPSESEKKPLHWHDHDFDQILKKTDSDKQTYYPTPVTLLAPNDDTRSDANCLRGNMVTSAHTADVASNLERDQWITTYDRTHTGIGPANPSKLDNYYDRLGQDGDDDTLRPGTTRTFDPPRPVEGRIARSLDRNPPPQTNVFPEYLKDNTYIRKMTDSEREEHRLWNGKDYVNLPDGWTPPQSAEPTMRTTTNSLQAHGVSTTSAQGVTESYSVGPIEQLAIEHHDNVQQIEAANRWKVLEAQQPHHNTQARQRKLDLASIKEQPAVFYGHETKFQRERAGLYNTTYDPYKLQGSMNREEESGARIMDISDCHKDALDLPTSLNQDMAEVIRYSRTLGTPGSVAQLNDQPNQHETFTPFNKAKSLQKAALQPNQNMADVRTQEGGLVLQESTCGDSYNTKKFLQENQLPGHVRNEPLQVMSNSNQNLGVARMSCTPNPTSGRPFKVPDDILQGDPLPGGNWLSKSYSFEDSRPHTSPEGTSRYSYSAGNLQTQNTSGAGNHLDLPVALERSRIASRYGVDDQLLSKSTNVLPTSTSLSWSGKSAYQSQYPGGATPRKPPLDLSFKNDDRFNWNPGFGTPRPQTTLLDIQESFSKSDVRKKFHQLFPENGVDLRDNIILGRKHNFSGMNAQVLRGAPIVD